MSYVERVMLPNETLVYRAQVSSALYIPGLTCLLLALGAAYVLPDIDQNIPWLYLLNMQMAETFPFISETANIVAVGLFLLGSGLMLKTFAIAASTEFAITSRRVIAKFGIASTVTTEIDRQKIAGVIIQQSPWGKVFDYGRVILRGYSGDISHLPPLSHPYEIQKYVNSRIRWG